MKSSHLQATKEIQLLDILMNILAPNLKADLVNLDSFMINFLVYSETSKLKMINSLLKTDHYLIRLTLLSVTLINIENGKPVL